MPAHAGAVKASLVPPPACVRNWPCRSAYTIVTWTRRRPIGYEGSNPEISVREVRMASRYHEVYEGWKRDPEGFWADAAKAIDWVSPPKTIFDKDAGVYGIWYPDATCNTCYNAVDRHVEGGRANQKALIYDSPITGRKKAFTYADVKEEVSALAALLQDHGVGKGDRVVIYMPMVPEAVFSMLACARIGAIHSVVFGGFASREL